MKIEQIGDYLTYIEKCTFDVLLDLSNKNDFTDLFTTQNLTIAKINTSPKSAASTINKI